MNNDRESLELSAKDASAVHTTINSRGWTQVIAPALEERKKALMHEFSGAEKFEDFIRIQQMINALDGLTNFIENKLIEGKEALAELKRNP
jgi:hypothetical protein